jgi:FtsH-binding integral membrane protein
MALSAETKFYLNFLHPLLMWGLLGLSLYAGYLGWQVRRTREASGDVKKELIKGKFNQRHFLFGSILLGLMVTGTFGGMLVTYINNGKLFVSPHLIVGAVMASLIALSAALAPSMQKGAEWARGAHIGLNTVLVGLFAWQALTGMQIIQRILEKYVGN